ncbi:MAG: glycerol-3-phosphate 1-O-acyltransferase PlsY [Alistipes sp.]|nr:glycerol-3-phosphate 1-O-acyltransferase PlsY [Alistipes sp.]MBR5850072.1 glycerol-3-phosphate 1-O-acyltransferase PlsY [Alistipes sp.]
MVLTYFFAFALLVIAYLLGSIPSAVWIGKRYYGVDIREHGSKNAGTTNMLRVLGKRAALPVFVLDFLKGFVAVTLVDLIKYDDFFATAPTENYFYIMRFAALFCAVLGHIFPIFAGFRGGKGVATIVGGVMALNAPLVLLCAGVWLLVLMVTHYVSLASMIAGACYPVFTLISPKVGHLPPFIIFSFIVAALLIYTHRKNITRLREGTESKIYVWKSRRVREEQQRQQAAIDGDQSLDEVVEELVDEYLEDSNSDQPKE